MEEDGGGVEEDGGGVEDCGRTEGEAYVVSERKKNDVLHLQKYPFFKVEKSKLSLVSVLCSKKCVQLSLLKKY